MLASLVATSEGDLMPPGIKKSDPNDALITYYQTLHELTFYLRAFQHAKDNRYVVVIGLNSDSNVQPADIPANVRLIFTTEAKHRDPDSIVGWYVPDPLRAVIVAMTGHQSQDGLILLFPKDWKGSPPELLLEKARRWRATPHSPVDDVFFVTD